MFGARKSDTVGPPTAIQRTSVRDHMCTHSESKKNWSGPGVEPGISGSIVRRLVHWATPMQNIQFQTIFFLQFIVSPVSELDSLWNKISIYLIR
jgi:hypothetical protein